MASVVIAGDTSGTITLAAPAVAGTNTLSLPAVTDTLVGLAATQTLTNKTLTSPTITGANMSSMASSVITSGNAVVVSGSPLTVTFTGIPSWAKRITIMVSALSTNGSSPYQVQLGTSGGFQATGYAGAVCRENGGAAQFSTGFQFTGAVAASTVVQGNIVVTNITGNQWVESGLVGYSDGIANGMSGGTVSLSGTLTQVRVITVNVTDTFDAGTVNILYE